MNKSVEIIEIFDDVVKQIGGSIDIVCKSYNGKMQTIQCPDINYTFGNAQYVKDKLDELSKSQSGTELKYPMIVLFCPFNEKRNDPDYYSTAKVNLLIACSSRKEWSNEERLTTSFKNILRPIYNRLLELLKGDSRFDFGYNESIKHEYSENYSYGRYGAYTEKGDEVSEPIDAINIRNLELKINKPIICNRK